MGTTANALLNGGTIINKNQKLIRVENIMVGFAHITALRDEFGEDSPFYKGIMGDISSKMNFNFEKILYTNLEVLYTEVAINYLQNGYTVCIKEAKTWIKNENYIEGIKKRMK